MNKIRFEVVGNHETEGWTNIFKDKRTYSRKSDAVRAMDKRLDLYGRWNFEIREVQVKTPRELTLGLYNSSTDSEGRTAYHFKWIRDSGEIQKDFYIGEIVKMREVLE